MTIKLHQFNIAKEADILSIAGTIWTQNGIETDLSTLAYIELAEGEPRDISTPYMDSDGIIHIHLTPDPFIQTYFIGDFYLTVADKDLNGTLDESELSAFVDIWNTPEDERRAIHKEILKK